MKRPDSPNFERAVNVTLGLEGGYSNNLDDAGGETNLGITIVTLRRAISDGIVVPETTIANLTVEQAKDIYYFYYWRPLRLDSITSYAIAAELFDTCVNMGAKTATLIAQAALNFLNSGVEEDGVMGEQTTARLNEWAKKDERALFICLNGEQYARYKLIRKVGKNYTFSRGWTKRIQQYQGT